MADGLGASLFTNTMAELAKDLHSRPIVKPVWSRETIPNPRELGTPTPPSLPLFYLHHSEIDLSWAFIKSLKKKYLEQTGQSCSTLESVVASLWQCRTRAIGLEPDSDMKLCIFANIRPMLGMGDGYYGNCVSLLRVSASCSMISHSPTVDLINLIKKAKAEFGEKVREWAKGESEEDPNDVKFTYNTLMVTDWTHLGFKAADFGWGAPVRIVPVLPASFYMNLLVLGLPSAKSGGDYRVMTRCVTEEHLPAFKDQMLKLK